MFCFFMGAKNLLKLLVPTAGAALGYGFFENLMFRDGLAERFLSHKLDFQLYTGFLWGAFGFLNYSLTGGEKNRVRRGIDIVANTILGVTLEDCFYWMFDGSSPDLTWTREYFAEAGEVVSPEFFGVPAGYYIGFGIYGLYALSEFLVGRKSERVDL